MSREPELTPRSEPSTHTSKALTLQSIPSPKGALPWRVDRESAYHRSQAETIGRRASL
jgi:hypothetical protein